MEDKQPRQAWPSWDSVQTSPKWLGPVHIYSPSGPSVDDTGARLARLSLVNVPRILVSKFDF